MAQGQNLDFNIAANVTGMEELARLINRVGALEKEIKSVQQANSALNNSTQTVIRNGTRYNNQLDAQSRALRNARQGTQQLGMQINDFATSVSTGASPIQAFNQQIGQVGYAMSMMGGTAARVGAFLAGPWGAAITFATMGLGVLWQQTRKNEEVARSYEDVLYDTASSYDAVVAASREYNEAMERENRSRAESLHFQRATIAANLIEANSLLIRARARRNEARAALTDPMKAALMGQGLVTAISHYSDEATAAEGDFMSLSASLAEVERQIAQLGSGGSAAGGLGRMASAGRETAQALTQAEVAARELFRQYEAGNISRADFLRGAQQAVEIHRGEEKATRNQVQALEQYVRTVEAATAALQNRASIQRTLSQGITAANDNFVLPDSVAQQAIANAQAVRDAIRGYTDDMGKSFDAVGENIAAAFQGMVTGAMGWKTAMRGIIQEVINQLFRLYVTQQIVGLIGGALGGLGLPAPVPARAVGGSVDQNRPYVVGERGPELFVPRGNGTIIPNKNMPGGGGSTINVSVDARGATSPEMVRQQVQQGILEAAPSIVAAAEQRTISTLRRPRLAGAL